MKKQVMGMVFSVGVMVMGGQAIAQEIAQETQQGHALTGSTLHHSMDLDAQMQQQKGDALKTITADLEAQITPVVTQANTLMVSDIMARQAMQVAKTLASPAEEKVIASVSRDTE
ncbi:hypothetical protein JCM19237_840 [Photobacterium aphoticum]|uniref:Uncharacterized protein n=1 Tax=Photobacterium aphoticum TaxID=754436 RepID=A0A090RJC0_9GAMM|nr:hypothetical protein JCM19237_840 [Photobacterium aphoticum]